MSKKKKVEDEITITVTFSEILALTQTTDGFFTVCKAANIEVPAPFRAALYGLFFRMMMRLKEQQDAESK